MVLSVMLLLLTGCSEEKENAPSEEETDEKEVIIDTVISEDVEMSYCRFGQGEKVFVILPGLSVKSVAAGGESVAEAFKDFSEDYTVYLFDQRNDPPENYSVEQMAEDTAAIMKELGIEKASFFGASLGGMVAEEIAILHPEMCEKLVLGSTVLRANETLKAMVQAWIDLAEEKDAYGLNKAIDEAVYSEATMEAYGDILLANADSITEDEMEHFIRIASAILEFDIYDRADEIQCDVLVLASEGDQVTTLEGAREIVQLLECEYYYYGPEYGHAVYDEAPDYRERMLDFLNQ